MPLHPIPGAKVQAGSRLGPDCPFSQQDEIRTTVLFGPCCYPIMVPPCLLVLPFLLVQAVLAQGQEGM